MQHLKPAARRVQQAANDRGIAIEVVEMPESTRTAEDAARACGCNVAQIVKSLVFKDAETGAPILLLVSGANRVNERRVGHLLGATLSRPDAAFVRDVTGFAIGGIPPFGHATRLRTHLDEDLLRHDVVWAAAGTPESVFSIAPRALETATGADFMKMT